ncbi:MAG: thrombospondin type 3 repeat-containing protein [Kofleriaceae bacterium]
MRLVVVVLLAGCDLVFLDDRSPCPITEEARCGLGDPDEDNDDTPDDCDPCPQIANATTDSDGDGIGDACDPEPTEKATCSSRWFFGFEDAAHWRDTTGWSFDGSATTEDPAFSSGRLVMLRSIETHGFGRIETVVHDQSIEGGPTAISGVVVLASDDGAYLCGRIQSTEIAEKLVIIHLDGTNERVLAQSEEEVNATPGVMHRIVLTVTSTSLACASYSPTGTTPRQSVSVPAPERSDSGGIGIFLESEGSQFFYLDFIPQ